MLELKSDVIDEETDALANSRANLANRLELEWYGTSGGGLTAPACSPLLVSLTDPPDANQDEETNE